METNTTKPARFHYRLGANQPAASPTARRLAEMAEAILHETSGEFRLEVFPESRLGPDPKMFADLRANVLEFYLAGATLGEVAPTSALSLLPFAFKDADAVFAAGSAHAVGTPEQRRACTPDVYRLCPGEIPNVRAITACLRRQKASLSEACRAAFEQGDR